MRTTALILHGREDVRLEEVEIPLPGPGEVRARILCATTCGTDLKVFRRGYHARMIVPPAPFGHEACGIVESVGEGVTNFRPGDRAVWANSAPCGDCFYCLREQEELCSDLLFWNGAYAGAALLPARLVQRNLHPAPAVLPDEALCLLEPLACALHGVAETEVRPGDDVVVLGAGPMGLLLTRCASLRGARVLVVGRRPNRLARARAAGADDVCDLGGDEALEWVRSRTGGRGADRVIEAVGQAAAWELAIRLVRPGGLVNLFGGCPSGTSIGLDAGRMHYDALRLVATFHHTPRSVAAALDLLASGDITADLLVDETISLDRFASRLTELARDGGPLKAAVRPSATDQPS